MRHVTALVSPRLFDRPSGTMATSSSSGGRSGNGIIGSMPRDEQADPQTDSASRLLDRAFRRAGGLPQRGGNRVRLLRDATENYPAWFAAIRSARHTIHFEMYIIHDDEAGRRFGKALVERAQAGVRVRLLFDWWGARGIASRHFWRMLRNGGVDVRCFNPPCVESPLGWMRRDHRKMIAVDGRLAFVSGLCIGQAWLGDAARGVEPWRDTGIEIEGPVVADVERAFASTWAMTGGPLPPEETQSGPQPPAGDVTAWLIATVPGSAELYRVDHVIAAAATRTLWLTDAYFVATTRFVDVLRVAARDGVDVRLLVPSASDIPGLRAVSRAGYRPLLEAGIRVFEWNGSMLHAKSAVADGRWARVGSTNLNPASWIGNWELDVLIEDDAFAGNMTDMYLRDLALATEVVLSRRRRVTPVEAGLDVTSRHVKGAGSAGRVTAGAIGIGSAIGAAITGRRELGPAEGRVLAVCGGVLLLLSMVVAYWPRALAVPVSIASLWMGLALLWRARRLHTESFRAQARRP